MNSLKRMIQPEEENHLQEGCGNWARGTHLLGEADAVSAPFLYLPSCAALIRGFPDPNRRHAPTANDSGDGKKAMTPPAPAAEVGTCCCHIEVFEVATARQSTHAHFGIWT